MHGLMKMVKLVFAVHTRRGHEGHDGRSLSAKLSAPHEEGGLT